MSIDHSSDSLHFVVQGYLIYIVSSKLVNRLVKSNYHAPEIMCLILPS